MEVVTQTNTVKSPTDSPATTKLVYTVEEIARMLAISLRSAYNLYNSTTEFRVLRVGGSIRRAGTGERRVNCHTSGSGFVRPGDPLGTPALAGQRRDILRLCLAFWHLFNSVANKKASSLFRSLAFGIYFSCFAASFFRYTSNTVFVRRMPAAVFMVKRNSQRLWKN